MLGVGLVRGKVSKGLGDTDYQVGLQQMPLLEVELQLGGDV